MSFLLTVLLGIIQGITEFLPVSSSAHLKIVKTLFHVPESQATLLFDLFCHLGTATATFLFLRKQIYQILFREPKELLFFFVALLPLVPFYFLLSPYFAPFSQVQFVGFFWCLTGLILLFSSYYKKMVSFPLPGPRKLKDSFLIGLGQCLALFPGLSRSGLTISAASLRGWDLPRAVTFSFLLSIPTIAGGSFLETMHLMRSKDASFLTPLHYFLGFLVSFVVGFFALRFIFSLKERKKIRPFGWYCLTAGLLSIIYFYVW